MKLPLFALFIYFLSTGKVQSQTIFYINAGSRALWGTTQELMITKDGKCSYFLKQVDGVVKDSSFFSFTTSQMDSLFNKAVQSGFFNLNGRYDGKAVDGAGIYISLNNAGKKHSVHLINTDLPGINDLIGWLNTVLAAHRIKINYGQTPPK